jgi:oligopeptide transport system permease protein
MTGRAHLAVRSLRRTGAAVLQLLAAATLVFLAISALPGDPARALAGGNRPLSPETRAAVERRFGLGEPLPSRYVTFMSGLVRGDLGESYRERRPVREIVVDRAPATITLTLAVLVVEAGLGVAAGVLAALRRSRFVDSLLLVSLSLSLAMPVYLLASLAQYALGLRWGLLPVSGTGAGWRSWVLPAVVLAAPSTAWIALLLRGSMAEQLERGHARAARSLGFPARRVARQSLRMAAPPVVTFAALDLAALLGGAVVVESIFNIPGIGREIVDAIRVRDNATLIGLTTLLVAVFVAANALADVVNGLLDPRVGARG